MRLAAIFAFLAALLVCIAWMRPAEYDEAYSIFLTAGHARPAWPAGIFHAGDVRHFYISQPGLGRISQDLRFGDVHPPLYFWALDDWRRVFGPSWFAARLLSVVTSLAALLLLARLAVVVEVPVIPTILIAGLSYGFAYTGIIARGFAFAQFFNVLGVVLIVSAVQMRRQSRAWWAWWGGVALGAAGFSNYLACLTGLAMLLWLLTARPRLKLFCCAAFGFAVFIPADAYFFLAQKSSRIGQFAPFSWGHAVVLLIKDSGAALFGGLPLYAGRSEPVVMLVLGILFLCSLGFAFRHRHAFSEFLAWLALASPIGLLGLGILFGNTPIEIRYLAFSLPFLALLLAVLPKPLVYLCIGVECAGLATLILSATEQPQAIAAGQAAKRASSGALVLLPAGNDGVGIPGPFIEAAPDDLRILLLHPNLQPELSGEQHILLGTIGIDGASRQIIQQFRDAISQNPCWHAETGTPFIIQFDRICTDQTKRMIN